MLTRKVNIQNQSAKGEILDDTEWIFDRLYKLGDAADHYGMKRLSRLLDLCMDVYIEEEQLVLEAGMMFRSRRALDLRKKRLVWPFDKNTVQDSTLRTPPPDWLENLECRIFATLKDAEKFERPSIVSR